MAKTDHTPRPGNVLRSYQAAGGEWHAIIRLDKPKGLRVDCASGVYELPEGRRVNVESDGSGGYRLIRRR